MTKNKKNNNSFSNLLSQAVVHGLQEKKGNEIVRLDLRSISGTITDYFVITHADSAAQVSALARSVEEEVYKACKQSPWRKEGLELSEWVIIDFVDVVVHIFRTDKRQYYGIEDLWGDADTEIYQSA